MTSSAPILPAGHQVTWDELQIRRQLRYVAQRIWDALETLADAHGRAARLAASAEATAQGEPAPPFEHAAAISHDATPEARDELAAGPARSPPAVRRRARRRPPSDGSGPPTTSVAGELLRLLGRAGSAPAPRRPRG